MGALDKFLERWGLVRLRDFGLILTPERRVLATRPAILDDGVGGRIVGWVDGDLAAMELAPWDPGQRGAAPRAQDRPAAGPPPQPRRPIANTIAPPVVAPTPEAVALVAPELVAAPPPPTAAAMMPATVVTATEPDPEPADEDWEWEIAVARARAAELDAAGEMAAPMARSRPPAPQPSSALPSVRSLAPAPLSDGTPEEDTRIRSFAPPTVEPWPAPPPAAAHAPRTVIPVPTFPAAADPRRVRPTTVRERPPQRLARASQRISPAPAANDDGTEPTIVRDPRTGEHATRIR